MYYTCDISHVDVVSKFHKHIIGECNCYDSPNSTSNKVKVIIIIVVVGAMS